MGTYVITERSELQNFSSFFPYFNSNLANLKFIKTSTSTEVTEILTEFTPSLIPNDSGAETTIVLIQTDSSLAPSQSKADFL